MLPLKAIFFVEKRRKSNATAPEQKRDGRFQRHLPGRHHYGLPLTNQGEGMRDPPLLLTFSDLRMTERRLMSNFRKTFGGKKQNKQKKFPQKTAALELPYRHAVEGQLAVDLELVGRGHPPAGVHQRVAELEGRNRKLLLVVWLFFLLLLIFFLLPTAASESESSHQEEHPLLEALPRQLAEAPEPDELLEEEAAATSTDGVKEQTREREDVRLCQNGRIPCWGRPGHRCPSGPSSAPAASGSSPSSSWCPGAAAPSPRCPPGRLQSQTEGRFSFFGFGLEIEN